MRNLMAAFAFVILSLLAIDQAAKHWHSRVIVQDTIHHSCAG
jgi:hypothetical protein